MGLKCPVCLKDFGKNKKEWEEHIKSAHNGLGKDVERVITKIYGPSLDKDNKKWI